MSILGDVTAYVAKEVAAAEAAVGPSLASFGGILVELETAIEKAVATTTTREEAEAVVDPVVTTLVAMLGTYMGNSAAAQTFGKYVVAGVNDTIETLLPAPAPAQPAAQSAS